MDRDLLTHPPTFFESISEADFSDRFYSSLAVVPTLVSSLMALLCCILLWNEYIRAKDEEPLTSAVGFRLFILISLFVVDMVFRIKRIIPAGRALKLFEESRFKNKKIHEVLSFDWRESMVLFFWISCRESP